MKSVDEFVPNFSSTRCIQADIESNLAAKADRIRKKRKLSWKVLMTSFLQEFVAELYPKPDPEVPQEPLRKLTYEERVQMDMFK